MVVQFRSYIPPLSAHTHTHPLGTAWGSTSCCLVGHVLILLFLPPLAERLDYLGGDREREGKSQERVRYFCDAPLPRLFPSSQYCLLAFVMSAFAKLPQLFFVPGKSRKRPEQGFVL